ncbi:MAG: hypothetical protein EXX96DRAFT_556300 [Benjaminiella poitrasii]|nr:MAG: hypothetical protein EXX96DRAFT_556300 [Benjaminiella poitrasii]
MSEESQTTIIPNITITAAASVDDDETSTKSPETRLIQPQVIVNLDDDDDDDSEDNEEPVKDTNTIRNSSNDKQSIVISDSNESSPVLSTDIESTIAATSTSTTNTISYTSADNEIWTTIAQQQDASLQALHQSIQMNDLNNKSPINKNTSITHSINSTEIQPVTQIAKTITNGRDDKPPVGSEEWRRLRRENHKQVERRRRETINDGINEIARIVPGCEKNKGSILQRAAAYIRQLKESEGSTLEKWTLEKLLTDQAINELNRQVEVLKTELDRVRTENTYLKRQLENESQPEPKKQKVADSEE